MPSPDPDYLINNWSCVPEPEQVLFRAMAELVNTPFSSMGFNQAKAILTAAGAFPAYERTVVVFERYKLPVVGQNPFSCFDPDGCVNIPGSYVLQDLWACMLSGGCPVGAPEAPPCRFPLTKP